MNITPKQKAFIKLIPLSILILSGLSYTLCDIIHNINYAMSQIEHKKFSNFFEYFTSVNSIVFQNITYPSFIFIDLSIIIILIAIVILAIEGITNLKESYK